MAKHQKREGKTPRRKGALSLWFDRALTGHSDVICGLAWSPDGWTLASSSYDTTVRLWDSDGRGLLRELRGHAGCVTSLAWSPDGETIASGSYDQTIRLWNVTNDDVRILTGHDEWVNAVAWSPDGRILASGSADWRIKFWDGETAELSENVEWRYGEVTSLLWSPDSRLLASGFLDGMIRLYHASTGRVAAELPGHTDLVTSLEWIRSGEMLVSSSVDKTIRLWDVPAQFHEEVTKILPSSDLRGHHTARVTSVSLSPDGRLLASKSSDGTIRLWCCETWQPVETHAEPASDNWRPSLAFHPLQDRLASAGANDRIIQIWNLDVETLLESEPEPSPRQTTAKIVLLGDSGVGKTALGLRLAYGDFQPSPATRDQHFWVLNALKTKRDDLTDCEAVLWDLDGHSEFRPLSTLLFDGVDLALIVFNPRDLRAPFESVELWLSTLQRALRAHGTDRPPCRTILVGARMDLETPTVTDEDIRDFCRRRGISGGYVATSAKRGDGIDDLIKCMANQIEWDSKANTISTETFRRMEQFLVALKQDPNQERNLFDPEELRRQLEETDLDWKFTDDQLVTAIEHLAQYGYVRMLRTATGEDRVLLSPNILHSLASSLVLEASRNRGGRGSLDENRLYEGRYDLQELSAVSDEDRETLLDAVIEMLVQRNVCFRQTIDNKPHLVFPGLVYRGRPEVDEIDAVDDAYYSLKGDVENVYAVLVVCLNYAPLVKMTHCWRDEARFEIADGVFGVRRLSQSSDTLDLLLYHDQSVPEDPKRIFHRALRLFMSDCDVSVERYMPQTCSECGHTLPRDDLVSFVRENRDRMFCSGCGASAELPKAAEEATRRRKDACNVGDEEARKSGPPFVEEVLRLTEKRKKSATNISCFISYACGEPEDEYWVEERLARVLERTGIEVVLDKWQNAKTGARITPFIDKIEECTFIIVVGTPLYFERYRDSKALHAVNVEMDRISQRLWGPNETVLPLLLRGEKESSLPPSMRGRVIADFRSKDAYSLSMLDLLLTMHGIPFDLPAVSDLRRSFAPGK